MKSLRVLAEVGVIPLLKIASVVAFIFLTLALFVFMWNLAFAPMAITMVALILLGVAIYFLRK